MTAGGDRSGAELQTEAGSLVGTGKDGISANDSLEQNPAGANGKPTGRVYITQKRVAAIAARLDAYHWAMLNDVGRLGVATGKQLRRLHFDASDGSARLARKKLAQLSSWQVLTRLGRPVSGWGYVYAVGVAGQRLLYPERKRHRPPWIPRPSYLRHALAVSDFYVGLRERESSGQAVLVTYDTEPACWRQFAGPGGSRVILKPDALAVLHIGEFVDSYFIEADCGTEPGPRITAKARNYARYWQSGREQAGSGGGIFPYVFWMAPTDKRKAFLIDCLTRLPPDHWQLFVVLTAEEAAQHMTTGTAVPITNREEDRR